MTWLPQETIRIKRDGGTLDAPDLRENRAKHRRRQPERRAGRRVRDGGSFPRHDACGMRGLHDCDARYRRGLRLARRVAARSRARQAFDGRRRRSRIARTRSDARRLRRVGANDRRTGARAHRRNARQARIDPRLPVATAPGTRTARTPRCRCGDHRRGRSHRTRGPKALCNTRRHGDGRLPPADRRLDPLEETGRRPGCAGARHQDRAAGP